MPQIRAIETIYKGYRFRSRLEVRWAVFFDTLGIRYEYEKEGFELGDGLRYLPDIWLPTQRCWVEIKPEDPTEIEVEKARRLARQSGLAVYIFSGSFAVPPVARGFFAGGTEERPMYWQLCPVCRTYTIQSNLWADEPQWYCGECDCGDRRAEHIAHGTQLGYRFAKGDWLADEPVNCFLATELVAAYLAAQQARFERFGRGDG